MITTYAQRLQLERSYFAEHSCDTTVEEEGVLGSPNYPFYYGMDRSCKWTILAPLHRYVKLDIVQLELAGDSVSYNTYFYKQLPAYNNEWTFISIHTDLCTISCQSSYRSR